MGVKKSIVVDKNGAPLSIAVGPANRHDSKYYKDHLKEVCKLKGNKIMVLTADSAYDSKALRAESAANAIALLASTNRRKRKDAVVFHPKSRWIVERTFGWLNWQRGIKFCWAKLQSSYQALCTLACTMRVFNMI